MKRPRVRHEIRSMAGAELYGRLLREAAARGLTVSECVRRELEELYAFRDELGDALRIAGGDGAPARGLFDAALKGLEPAWPATSARSWSVSTASSGTSRGSRRWSTASTSASCCTSRTFRSSCARGDSSAPPSDTEHGSRSSRG